MTLISPKDPFSLWALCCLPCYKWRCGAAPEVLLPAGLWAHFGLTPEEGQQVRNRGGYSPVLNGVAPGFSALAQCLAMVSAQLSRSDPWERRETAWLTLLQSCPRHCRNKWGSAVGQKHCSGVLAGDRIVPLLPSWLDRLRELTCLLLICAADRCCLYNWWEKQTFPSPPLHMKIMQFNISMSFSLLIKTELLTYCGLNR